MEFIFPVVIVAAFYFILLKPVLGEQSKRKKIIASLNIGDKVVISGGLIAIISEIIITEDGSSVLQLSLSKKNFVYAYPEAVERLVEDSAIKNLDDIIN